MSERQKNSSNALQNKTSEKQLERKEEEKKINMDKTQCLGKGRVGKKLSSDSKTLINSEKPSMRWKSGRTAKAGTGRI